MHCIAALTDWLHRYEFIAIWIEGFALVAIFVLDWFTRREQHDETMAHLDIARKQIHAERVAEIWSALRTFEYFIVWGQIEGKVGPGKDFSEHGNLGTKGGKIFKEYVALQEAYYLAYLVSDPLAAYMKQRMEEADSLQRVGDPAEFGRRLQEFLKNWNVYEMTKKLRELS